MHVAESTMINRGIPQKQYRTASRDSLFPATVDQSICSSAPSSKPISTLDLWSSNQHLYPPSPGLRVSLNALSTSLSLGSLEKSLSSEPTDSIVLDTASVFMAQEQDVEVVEASSLTWIRPRGLLLCSC